MKFNFASIILLGVAALLTIPPGAFAQSQLAKRKGPTSKLYLAETKGDTQIQNGDKIYAARQSTAFDAPGTTIETGNDSHNALVYSNGTGLFIDQNARIEIARFVQEAFKPDPTIGADAPVEPSVSQSDVMVARGTVGICTSQLAAGSSMTYNTPLASVNIRGGRLLIAASANETTIDLLEGDVTVRSGARDAGGQLLRAGERAVIRASATGSPSLTLGPIPPEVMLAVDARVGLACNARKTVSFEMIEIKAGVGLDGEGNAAAAEIVARPTVPGSLPSNIVISPDRLPQG